MSKEPWFKWYKELTKGVEERSKRILKEVLEVAPKEGKIPHPLDENITEIKSEHIKSALIDRLIKHPDAKYFAQDSYELYEFLYEEAKKEPPTEIGVLVRLYVYNNAYGNLEIILPPHSFELSNDNYCIPTAFNLLVEDLSRELSKRLLE